MADTNTEDQRISELLWRTIKLRISLLVVVIVAMLIVWSAVLSGDQRAKAIDVEYCERMVATATSSVATDGKRAAASPHIDTDSMCSEVTARGFLEGARNFNTVFQTIDLKNPTESATRFHQHQAQLLSEYDSKRALSYNFPIQVSSELSSGEMLVNALTVAKVVPFVTLMIAAIVIILGFQQRAYKTRLIQLGDRDKGAAALILARTQFFAFSSFARRENTGLIRWPILSPEGLALCGLWAAFVATFAGLLFAFAENVVHLTDSVIYSYTFNLYWVAFTLALWVRHTRKRYRETFEPRSGAAEHELRFKASRPITELLLVVLALISLLLPWALSAGGLSLKGYFFLFPEHVRNGIQQSQYLAINPRIFSELRWQLALALAFILLCGFESLVRRGVQSTKWFALHALRASLGVLTLMYSLNLLLYMIILEYEAIQGTSWGLQNMLFASLSGGTPGWPLDLYDPSYGFFIFLAASFALIWLSLATASGGKANLRTSSGT